MKSKTKKASIIVLIAVSVLVMIACPTPPDREVDTSQYYLNAPTGVAATVLSNNTVHLTWREVSNAGRYEISFRTNLDSADTRRLISSSTTDTRYEHSYYSWAVTTGVTTFYYYVKAHPRISGYVASGWSNPVSVNVR